MGLLRNEILEQIVFYVNENDNESNEKDIFECIRVCRDWKTVAQMIGYTSITLQYGSQLWKIAKGMTRESTQANFVKTLNCKFYPTTITTSRHLRVVSNLFMCIEHLNITLCDNSFT
jgi:hypothetical protein